MRDAGVLVVEVDRERRLAGAVSVAWSNFDVLRDERRSTARRPAPDGAGGGVALRGSRSASASQASKSAGASAWTSNSMIRWPTPQSSAHWPRYVWPASLAVDVEVELVRDPRHDVALEQELRDVERVDDVRAVQVEVDRLAGRERQAAVRALRGVDREQRPACRPGRRPARYSNDHWNWARDGPDLEVRLGRRRLDRVQGLPRDHEQEDHDDRRDERPDDLGEVVAVGLRRELVVAGLAAVADDRPDDQALDDEEDHDRDAEDDVVQVADVGRPGRSWRPAGRSCSRSPTRSGPPGRRRRPR